MISLLQFFLLQFCTKTIIYRVLTSRAKSIECLNFCASVYESNLEIYVNQVFKFLLSLAVSVLLSWYITQIISPNLCTFNNGQMSIFCHSNCSLWKCLPQWNHGISYFRKLEIYLVYYFYNWIHKSMPSANNSTQNNLTTCKFFLSYYLYVSLLSNNFLFLCAETIILLYKVYALHYFVDKLVTLPNI